MEEQKKMKGRNQGITLVALVITIIILLILAGITLNLTLGQNGIITRAQLAKEEWQNAEEREKKELDKLYSQMLIATGDNAQITINIEDLNKLIETKVAEEAKKLEDKMEKKLPNSINEQSLIMTATNKDTTKTSTSLTLKNFEPNFSENFNDYFDYNSTTGELTCKQNGWYSVYLQALITHGNSTEWVDNRLSMNINGVMVMQVIATWNRNYGDLVRSFWIGRKYRFGNYIFKKWR